jgi:hypothetical protein
MVNQCKLKGNSKTGMQRFLPHAKAIDTGRSVRPVLIYHISTFQRGWYAKIRKDKGISLETLEKPATVPADESTTLGFLMCVARSLTRSSRRVTYNSCTEVIGFG